MNQYEKEVFDKYVEQYQHGDAKRVKLYDPDKKYNWQKEVAIEIGDNNKVYVHGQGGVSYVVVKSVHKSITKSDVLAVYKVLPNGGVHRVRKGISQDDLSKSFLRSVAKELSRMVRKYSNQGMERRDASIKLIQMERAGRAMEKIGGFWYTIADIKRIIKTGYDHVFLRGSESKKANPISEIGLSVKKADDLNETQAGDMLSEIRQMIEMEYSADEAVKHMAKAYDVSVPYAMQMWKLQEQKLRAKGWTPETGDKK